MSAPLRVLAIAGSLKHGSLNRALVEAARDEAPAGVEVVVWEGLRGLPFYNEDEDGDRAAAAVREFRQLIGEADALLVATPEYNSSIPGVLKNALDWASRPYGAATIVAKPTAVIGASASSFGAMWAQDEVRKVLRASGALVLEDGVSFAKAAERLDAEGRVADAGIRAELAALLGTLAETARPGVPGVTGAPAGRADQADLADLAAV